MTIQVLFFGITTDIVGSSALSLELENSCSVKQLKAELLKQFPALQAINSYAIAINESYATDQESIPNNAVVALIPPVSGG